MVGTTTKRLVWYQSYHRERLEYGSAHGKGDFSVVKVYVDRNVKNPTSVKSTIESLRT